MKANQYGRYFIVSDGTCVMRIYLDGVDVTIKIINSPELLRLLNLYIYSHQNPLDVCTHSRF